MLVWWFPSLIGCLFVSVIYCEETDVSAIESDQQIEPEFRVVMSVKTQEEPPSPHSSNQQTTPTRFACHQCVNCDSKSGSSIQLCDSDVHMCYKMHKLVNNITRVIRRGCSTSKDQCSVPVDEHLHIFDSITCCPTHQCNQGIQFQPFAFLVVVIIITLLIITYS